MPPGVTPDPRDEFDIKLAAPGLPAAPPLGGGGTCLSPLPPDPLIEGLRPGGKGTPRAPPADENDVVRACVAGNTNRSATLAPGGLFRLALAMPPVCPRPELKLPGARASVGTKSGPESSERKRLESRDSTSASSKFGVLRYLTMSCNVPEGCGTGAKVCVLVGSAGSVGAGGVSNRRRLG